MTVSSLTPVNNYTGNGSVTTFDFDFFIENQNELVVTHINSNGISNVLEYGIDYSINEIGNENGSYIEFPISGSKYGNLASGEILSLSLTLPIKQESKFANSSSLNLVVLEKTFDYLVRILQILNRKIERSIKVQEGSSVSPDGLIQQLEKAERNTSMYSSRCETLTKDAGTYRENAELQASFAEKSAQEALEVKNELVQGNMFKYQLFDIVQKDHVLAYEESQGFELLGSYVYKNAVAGSRYGYPDFYEKCLEEKEQGTETQVTLGENTITMFVNANGHQFFDIADKETVDTFYNSTGVAWFYGIDTDNECIFLPRNDYLTSYVNNGETPVAYDMSTTNNMQMRIPLNDSLGRLNMLFNGVSSSDNTEGLTGANNSSNYGQVQYTGTGYSTSDLPSGGTTGTVTPSKVNLDPNGTLYVDISNVKDTNRYAYMVVGNTTADTSWVDVVTQVNSGVKDLEDKTNEGIEALSNASNALRQTQITNCLLEVPQNIKLELVDGVLTLKAGSKVIVPNGVGVFKELTVTKDLDVSSGTGQKIIMVTSDGNFITTVDLAKSCSGSTDSLNGVVYHAWYDTTNNIIKRYGADVSTPSSIASFPIAIATFTDNIHCTIDHVFNGFGYIGSTFWADKGVKGLRPNGKNTNGTLKHNEYTTSKILTAPARVSNGCGFVLLYDVGMLSDIGSDRYYEQDNMPFEPYGSYKGWYSPKDNITYSDNGSWIKTNYHVIGKYTTENGKITSIEMKQPFRAVDYNDKQEIASWGFPSDKYVDLTLGATGSSYTAPANGWAVISKRTSAANQQVSLGISNSIRWMAYHPISGSACSVSLPVRKGQSFYCTYSAGGTLDFFRFVYAEGGQ